MDKRKTPKAMLYRWVEWSDPAKRDSPKPLAVVGEPGEYAALAYDAVASECCPSPLVPKPGLVSVQEAGDPRYDDSVVVLEVRSNSLKINIFAVDMKSAGVALVAVEALAKKKAAEALAKKGGGEYVETCQGCNNDPCSCDANYAQYKRDMKKKL